MKESLEQTSHIDDWPTYSYDNFEKIFPIISNTFATTWIVSESCLIFFILSLIAAIATGSSLIKSW